MADAEWVKLAVAQWEVEDLLREISCPLRDLEQQKDGVVEPNLFLVGVVDFC